MQMFLLSGVTFIYSYILRTRLKTFPGCLISPSMSSPVHWLPELCDPWLPGGQPDSGALHCSVQWSVAVGPAHGAQQAHTSDPSRGHYQVHPCGSGKRQAAVMHCRWSLHSRFLSGWRRLIRKQPTHKSYTFPMSTSDTKFTRQPKTDSSLLKCTMTKQATILFLHVWPV